MNELSEIVTEEIQTILPSYDATVFDGLSITPEETLFVYHYCETNDAGKAYAIVYGESSPIKARKAAHNLIRRKDIKAAIDKMGEAIFSYALKTLPLSLMQDIQAVRGLDVLDYYKADGSARMLDAIPREKRLLIENVDIIVNSKTGLVEYRYVLPSKSNTTRMLMDLLKMRDLTKDEDKATANDGMKEAASMREKLLGSVK